MLNKWEIENGKRICYFDIDGVLNDYPESWVRFLREEKGDEVVECIGSYDLLHHLDLTLAKTSIPYQKYIDLKAKYRSSGYKENLPVTPGAAAVIRYLKRLGYHIVIITSRPLNKHPELFKQTTNWLDKNEIIYDDLIFSPEKHLPVLSRYPHLKFGVEDNRYYANLVASWGYKMFLLDNDYNGGKINKNVQRIYSINEILEWV